MIHYSFFSDFYVDFSQYFVHEKPFAYFQELNNQEHVVNVPFDELDEELLYHVVIPKTKRKKKEKTILSITTAKDKLQNKLITFKSFGFSWK